jgi:hypothetical protein
VATSKPAATTLPEVGLKFDKHFHCRRFPAPFAPKTENFSFKTM